MPPTLDAFGVVVADMGRAVAFYALLGLTFPDDAAAQRHVEATLPGGVRLMFDTRELVQQLCPDWTPPAGGHRTALAFRCDTPAEVDGVYAAVVAEGHPGKREPWDAFWGQRYAQLEDPDGNAVDLFADLQAS